MAELETYETTPDESRVAAEIVEDWRLWLAMPTHRGGDTPTDPLSRDGLFCLTQLIAEGFMLRRTQTE